MCIPILERVSGLKCGVDFKVGYRPERINPGDKVYRLENIHYTGYHISTLIHPTAYVSPDAHLAPGCIIRTFAVVGRYAQLGKATILNIGAKVDHHCIIGEGSHLLINAVVRASRTIDLLTWVEAGRIIQ